MVIEHVHWDMDGVIADTEPLHVQAEIDTCKANGFAIDESSWNGFKGQTAQAIFRHLITTHGNPEVHKVDELIAHKTDRFIELATAGLVPIDGALTFMRWVRGRATTMNLVTSSNRRVQTHIVEAFDIGHMLDHVVTGDDIKNGKPHPEPYIRASQFAEADPSTVLVIEDSKSGITSALGAGCMVLAIATSHTPEELMGANPTFIATDYRDAQRQVADYFVV